MKKKVFKKILKKKRQSVYINWLIFLIIYLFILTLAIINQINKIQRYEQIKDSSIGLAKGYIMDIHEMSSFCKTFILAPDTILETKYMNIVQQYKGYIPWPDGAIISYQDSINKLNISEYEKNLLRYAEKIALKLMHDEQLAFRLIQDSFFYKDSIGIVQQEAGTQRATMMVTSNDYYLHKKAFRKTTDAFINTVDKRINTKIIYLKKWVRILVILMMLSLLITIGITSYTIHHLVKRLRTKLFDLVRTKKITYRAINEIETKQKVIQESEIKFKALFEDSSNAIIIYGKKGFIECNNAAVKLLGSKNKDDLLFRHPSEFSPEYQPDGQLSVTKSNEMISIAKRNGTNRFDWMHKNISTGHLFQVEVSLSYMSINNENIVLSILYDLSERKKIDKDMSIVQAQLKFLFDVLPVGVVRYDKHGKVIEANRFSEEFLGLSKKKSKRNQKKWCLKKPDGSPLPLEEYPTNRVIAGENKVDEVEVLMSLPKNKKNHTIVSARRLGDYGIMETIVDVSKIKQAENDLAVLSQIVFNSLNSANIGAWWIEFDDNYLLHGLTNMSEIVGIKEVGKNTFSLRDWHRKLALSKRMFPKYSSLINARRDKIKKLLSGEDNAYNVVYPILSDAGKLKWIDERGTITRRSVDGKALFMTGTINDVTSQKNIEKEFENAKQTLELAIDAASVSVWDWDILKDKIKWDDTGYKLYGISKDYVRSNYESWNILIHPDDKSKAKTDLNNAIKGHCNYDSEFRIMWPDLTVRHIRAIAKVITNSKGEAIRMIGVQWDVSDWRINEQELKNAKEMAEQATMAKSIFLANMSHEIRTPMNAILGFTDLLERKILDKTNRSYLKSIRTSGDNLLELIDDILDLSKIEAGKLAIKKGPTDIQRFFDEIRKMFAFKIEDKGLHFITNFSENIPATLELDELRLKQILINLIGNAVKFTDKGYIKLDVYCEEINTTSDGNRTSKYVNLVLKVEDSGMGIEKDFIKTMYDSFSQQEGQSTRKYGGAGLGLSITKRIIKLMNGVINVESTIGKGSVFTVKLPKVKIIAQRLVQEENQEFDFDAIQFKPGTVLFADNDSENRKLISEIMTLAGLTFYEASNGSELLKLAKINPPDIILTDIFMPEMNGIELLNTVKQRRELSNIPIYALTASANDDSLAMLRKEKFDGVLTKPLLVDDLYNVLMKHIEYETIFKSRPDISTKESIKHLDDSLIDEIVSIFNSELNQRWEQLRIKKPIDEMEEFACSFISLGEQYQIRSFSNYGENLQVAVSNFDIEKIIELINHYPKMINTLKQ
jgi:two-component system sensor histidine kinase EvgS